MKTSVVMATFNGDLYIREQIESLFQQSVLPDEMIVADDGSNDKTLSIIDQLAKIAPFPIKLIKREKKLGYAHNFSDASLQASNDIILFCDQDDYWEPSKIKLIKQWFTKNQDKSLAIHNIAICNENLDIQIGNYFNYLDKNHARHIFLKGCATAIRSNLINSAFPLPTNRGWHHDNRVHAIARLNNQCGHIEDVLVRHRLHPFNTSGYIVKEKGVAARLMARLDEHGIETSPEWAFCIPLINFLSTKEDIQEFLNAGSRPELLEKLIQALDGLRKKNHMIRDPKSISEKFLQLLNLIRFFSKKGYSDIGGTSQFVADTIRLINN